MIRAILLLLTFIIQCESFQTITLKHQRYHDISKQQEKIGLLASFVFHDDPNRTLYDILGCSPSATKEELKKQYIKLAKLLHPDARINNSEVENNVEFCEVAAAWEVLSNDRERLKYDRSLRANEFISDVEKTASKLSESAAPHVKNVFDTVLNPMIRRTSVTTSAALSATFEDISQQNIANIDFKKTMQQAFKAVQNAGESIRQVELIEKINNLEQRSIQELNLVNELEQELKKVTLKRINYAIQTPESGLSSFDAKYFLDSLNVTDQKSIVGKMLNNRQLSTMNNNIAILESVEKDYSSKKSENLELINKETLQQQTLFRAQLKAQAALKAEEKARKALMEAEEYTRSCNQVLKESETSLSQTQIQLNKSTEEVNKVSNVLGRQQEKIRRCLIKKGMLVSDDHNDDVKMNDVSSIEDEAFRMLTELKKEEQALALEKKKIEDRLLRMQSRKEKLKLNIKSGNLQLGKVTLWQD